ncbi:hypothetical protein BDR26DRAFT_816214 [Obelidium mucronatum]|nr:hypothetical protein BDR26DRAFT_816214 [Obelidium mucronatum]
MIKNFNFTFTCNLPNQPTNKNLQTTRDEICNLVKTGLANAARRIQKWVLFQTPIKISISFESDCRRSSPQLDTDQIINCPWNKLLGAASPTSWNEVSGSETLEGFDPEYLYPPSLLKQYIPNDPRWIKSGDDISAGFNSDAPWWFPDESNPLGEGSGSGGSYAAPLTPDTFDNSVQPNDKIYDFEQTAIHEIMHGLGFMSGWGQSIQDNSLLPSGPLTYQTKNGKNGITLGKSFIYDRTLAHVGAGENRDGNGGVMMRDYASSMRREAEQISEVMMMESKSSEDFSTEWRKRFIESKAFQLSLNLYSSVATTPMQLVSWYQTGAGEYRYAIIYTPRRYSGGSSLSHLDASVYGGSSEYLMRPFCTSGAGIDGIVPIHRDVGVLGEAVSGILRQMGYITIE